MRSHLLEGDLQLPAQHKPFQNLRRVHGQVSAQQSLCDEFALGGSLTKTERRGTGGLPERYQTAVCDVSSTVQVAPSYQATDTSTHDTVGKSRSAFSVGSRRPFSGGRPFRPG